MCVAIVVILTVVVVFVVVVGVVVVVVVVVVYILMKAAKFRIAKNFNLIKVNKFYISLILFISLCLFFTHFCHTLYLPLFTFL